MLASLLGAVRGAGGSGGLASIPPASPRTAASPVASSALQHRYEETCFDETSDDGLMILRRCTQRRAVLQNG